MSARLKKIVSCLNTVCCRRYQKIQPAEGKLPENPKGHHKTGNAAPMKGTESDNKITLEESLTDGVRLLVDKTKCEDKQNERKDDWKNFARMLDNMCFFVALIVNLTLMVLYCVFVP